MATRWLVSFDAINPSDPKKTWKIGIPEWLYRKHQRQGHAATLARIVLVHEVIEGRTDHIRGGWSRQSAKDGCLVYVGYPSSEWTSAQVQLPPVPGSCFCVFVLPDGSIDDWTWRKVVSEGGDSRPQGVSGEVIWPLPNKSRNS